MRFCAQTIHMNWSSHLPRLRLAVLIGALAACPTRAAEECPAASAAAPAVTDDISVADDGRVRVTADRATTVLDRFSVFSGDVDLRRGVLRVQADELRYDEVGNRLDAHGNVRIGTNTGDDVSTPEAGFDLGTDRGHTGAAAFRLGDNRGRGRADRIHFEGRDRLRLNGVRFTSCPPGQDHWFLNARRMLLDNAKGEGTARSVTLEFMHVPILYAPWFSFPLTDARKTGFLVPRFGESSTRGVNVAAPYYLNLAPQYDDTITPAFMSRRGAMLRNEFRYLGESYNGDLEVEYLPNDNVFGDNRSALRYIHTQTISPHVSASLDIQSVSDKDYLADLGETTKVTSSTHVPSSATLSYGGRNIQAGVFVKSYQTLDPTIAVTNEPYERLPQMFAIADFPLGYNRPRLEIDSEYTFFNRSAGVTGHRVDLLPSVSIPWRTAYGYVTPKAGLHYTAYDLQGATNSTPERSLGVFSLDSGMFFDRPARLFGGDFTQTLEPRIFYLYVPYKDQDSFPNFDSGTPDFNFDNLFRENRFLGRDRVGDADQVTVAATTRFLDVGTGIERLRLSAGQTIYFSEQSVNIPPGVQSDDRTDLVLETRAWLRSDWYLRGTWQADLSNADTSKGNLYLTYHPAPDRIVNVAYRYLRDQQNQVDLSSQWPVAGRWTLFGRWNYSTLDSDTLQAYAGFSYRRCCWAVRAAATHRILGNGVPDSGFLFEFELTGLSKSGPAPESPIALGAFPFN